MVETPPPDEHATRVRESFDAFHAQVGERLDPASREAFEKLRTAAEVKDGEGLRNGLKQMRDSHGWLYRELSAHPQVATLLDELALLGF